MVALPEIQNVCARHQFSKAPKKMEADSTLMDISYIPDIAEKNKVPVKLECVKDDHNTKDIAQEETFGCIIATEGDFPAVHAALEALGLRVCYSTDGRHLPEYVPDECDVVFVCSNFSGPVYKYLRKSGLRIVGPPCVLSCARQNKPLPNSVKPIYSTSMDGSVVCFTGFRDKEGLQSLCDQVYWMSGIIHKKVTDEVTHVVAHSVSGSKYKAAMGLGTPIMSEDWVTKAWELRDNVEIQAIDEILMQYKQFPFAGCTLAFLGFTEEEESHMKEIAIDNGAEVKILGSSGVTHLVVANDVDSEDVPIVSSRVSAVKVQWFWESIQIEACADESMYLAKDAPCKKKRKRRSSAISTSCDRSGIDVSLFSITSSSLCSLSTPTKTEGVVTASEACNSPSPKDTARYHITSELLNTERNFVNVLQVLVTFFKLPLETPTMRGGPIIAAEDIKGIFANIDEILVVHERIMTNLIDLIRNWTDSTCIGTVLLAEAEDLVRVYPRFVNFFEISKETLHRCDRQHPRFHAFLKANESRPECARQSIEDLLITPVQRLPRIILLLQDLIKHTDPAHCDYANLQKALQSLRNVMTHINEDKRKTESQVQMFEVLRDIEECPALILSANRHFLCKVDVVDMASKTPKSDQLVLYLFSDCIEIAKKKSLGTFNRSGKQCRHIEFFSLMHCKSVVTFTDAPEMVGLLVRWPDDPENEKALVFKLTAPTEPNAAGVFAQQVCKQLANLHYLNDHEDFLIHTTADAIMAKASRKPASSLSFRKAFSGAKKKVKRVFSQRSHRKPLLNLQLHNAHCMDQGEGISSPFQSPSNNCSILEPPDSPGNQSIMSTQSLCTFTSVLDLRTPQPKRAAVSRSFGAADKKLAAVDKGTEVL